MSPDNNKIETFSDLLRILESHPEWRQRLRQALFPDLDLPKALHELAEAQRRTEEALQRLEAIVEKQTARLERLEDRVETGFAEAAADRKVIKESVDRLETRVDRMEERMEVGFAEAADDRASIRQTLVEAADDRASIRQTLVEAAQDRANMKQALAEAADDRASIRQTLVEAAQDRANMKQTLGELKGKAHEHFYHSRANAVFGTYLRRGRDATDTVADLLHEAVRAGKISDKERQQVMAADLLWSGQLRTTQEEVILIVEASWLAEIPDVERAVERANILRRIKQKALPVVAGREWAEGVPDLAQEQGVVLTTDGRVDDASWQSALEKALGN